MSFHINIELKARCDDQQAIREYLLKHATSTSGVDHQIDTYFNTDNGRLKLREGNVENSLIYYKRENTKGAKQSDINFIKLTPNSGFREILRKSNGIKVVVDKKREIFFIDNVKFHIDSVDGLGKFMEIEAIDMDGSFSIEKLQAQCEKYKKALNIEDADLISESYSDMILSRGREFKLDFEKNLKLFLESTITTLEEKGVNLESSYLDHCCYRVDSIEEYEFFKSKLSNISDNLVESIINNRRVSIYKLYQSIDFNGRTLDIIELTEPKKTNKYSNGFEHVEFVISESFEDFSKKYPSLDFDWSGVKKLHNSELRLVLEKGLSVKFHHTSLEELVINELTS